MDNFCIDLYNVGGNRVYDVMENFFLRLFNSLHGHEVTSIEIKQPRIFHSLCDNLVSFNINVIFQFI